jgi:hypothetical protein
MGMGISGEQPARRPARWMFGTQHFRTTSGAALLRFMLPTERPAKRRNTRRPPMYPPQQQKERNRQDWIFPFHRNAMGLCMTNL